MRPDRHPHGSNVAPGASAAQTPKEDGGRVGLWLFIFHSLAAAHRLTVASTRRVFFTSLVYLPVVLSLLVADRR